MTWEVVTKDKDRGGLGLHSMKLGWRLGAEPNALWARVMRFKYCEGNDLEVVANRQQSASNAWCCLMDVFELTKNRMGHAVGDVRHTKFWVHKWVDGSMLLNHATKEVPANHKERLVCDYWNAEKGWDWGQLAEFNALLLSSSSRKKLEIISPG